MKVLIEDTITGEASYLRILDFGIKCGSGKDRCRRGSNLMCLQPVCYWNYHLHLITFTGEIGHLYVCSECCDVHSSICNRTKSQGYNVHS